MADQITDIRLIIRSEVDRAINEIRKSNRELGKLDTTASNLNQKFKKLKNTVTGVVAALALRKVAQVTIELTKVAAEAANVKRAFDQVPDSANLFKTLKNNVKSAIPDLEIMRSAIVGLGLGATAEQLDIFSRFARLEGVRKGSDTLKVFNDILSGVLRGSTELLDNFGITLTQLNQELETLSVDKLNKSASKLTQLEKRMLSVDAAANIMNRRLAASGEIALTDAEKIQQMSAEFENAKVAIGGIISGPVISVFSSIRDVIKGLTDDMADQVQNFVTFRNETKAATTAAGGLLERYEKLKAIQTPTQEEQAELNKTIQALARLVPGSITAVNEYGEALDINKARITAFINAQRELLKRTQEEVFTDLVKEIQEAGVAFRNNTSIIIGNTEEIAKLQQLIDEFGRDYRVKVGESANYVNGVLAGTTAQYQAAGDLLDDLIEQSSEYQKNTADLSDNLDTLTLALSNFIDIGSVTPGRLSKELGISVEQADKLIERFKKLNEAAAGGGGGGGTGNVNKQLLKQAQETQKILEEFDKERRQQIIENAEEILKSYEARYNRQKDLDEEQLEFVRQIGEKEVAEGIAVADYLLEYWQFTEEKRKELIQLRAKFQEEADEEELARAERYADAITDVLGRPIAAISEQWLSGMNKNKITFQNFLKDIRGQMSRFMAQQIVRIFQNFFLNLFSGGTESVFRNTIFAPPAQQGAYIQGSPSGQIRRVGENNTTEVIIPVKKLADFLAGQYKLPGGYGVQNIPGLSQLSTPQLSVPAFTSAGPGFSNRGSAPPVIVNVPPGEQGRIVEELMNLRGDVQVLHTGKIVLQDDQAYELYESAKKRILSNA